MLIRSVLPTALALAVAALHWSPTYAAGLAQAADAGARDAVTLQTLGLSQVFVYFMTMLGPTNVLLPFASMTEGADEAARRLLALRGFAIACVAALIAALLGRSALVNLGISLPALLLAAGLVMLLVALRAVLKQYEVVPPEPEAVPVKPRLDHLAISPLAFPTIVTPYGAGVLILLLAAGGQGPGDIAILGVYLAVMLLNLLAMLFARPILKLLGTGPLLVVGAALAVLQVALAVQMLLLANGLLGGHPS